MTDEAWEGTAVGDDLAFSLPLTWLGNLPWRIGRSVGRTVYAQLGPDPSDVDVLIGMMDSRELAHAAVYAHNMHLLVLAERATRRADPT